MKKYTYNDINYELIKDYKAGFDNEEVKEKLTDFFIEYDYILGDWAYGKLRLKGFNNKDNNIQVIEGDIYNPIIYQDENITITFSEIDNFLLSLFENDNISAEEVKEISQVQFKYYLGVVGYRFFKSTGILPVFSFGYLLFKSDIMLSNLN